MNPVGWTIVGCIVVTALIKAAGPVLVGDREPSPAASRVIVLLAPALLGALVVTSVLADGDRWSVGADTVGVAAAAVVIWRRGSVIAAVVVAAGVTALLRLLT